MNPVTNLGTNERRACQRWRRGGVRAGWLQVQLHLLDLLARLAGLLLLQLQVLQIVQITTLLADQGMICANKGHPCDCFKNKRR